MLTLTPISNSSWPKTILFIALLAFFLAPLTQATFDPCPSPAPVPQEWCIGGVAEIVSANGQSVIDFTGPVTGVETSIVCTGGAINPNADMRYQVLVWFPQPTISPTDIDPSVYGLYEVMNKNAPEGNYQLWLGDQISAPNVAWHSAGDMRVRKRVVGTNTYDGDWFLGETPSNIKFLSNFLSSGFRGSFTVSVVTVPSCGYQFPQSVTVSPISPLLKSSSANLLFSSLTKPSPCTYTTFTTPWADCLLQTPVISTWLSTADILKDSPTTQIVCTRFGTPELSVPWSPLIPTKYCTNPHTSQWKVVHREGFDDFANAYCYCGCRGNWADDEGVLAQLAAGGTPERCTVCSLSCPELMVPNSDCSACTCAESATCKSFRRYLHTTVAFTPEAEALLFQFQYRASNSYTWPIPSSSLDSILKNLRTWSGLDKLANNLFRERFTEALRQYVLRQLNKTDRIKVTNLYVRRLVPGAYVYKITVDVELGELGSWSADQNFAMPLITTDAVEQALKAGLAQTPLGQTGITFTDTLLPYLVVPTMSLDVTNDQGQTQSVVVLKWFEDDTLSPRCLTPSQTLRDPSTITWDEVKDQKCPSVFDYYAFNADNQSLPESDQLWSKCTDTTVRTFQQVVQGLDFDGDGVLIPNSAPYTANGFSLDSDGFWTKTVSMTQLAPICFDFTGRNIGLIRPTDTSYTPSDGTPPRFGVSCGFNWPAMATLPGLAPFPDGGVGGGDIISDIRLRFQAQLQPSPLIVPPFDLTNRNYHLSIIQQNTLSMFPGFPEVIRMKCPYSDSHTATVPTSTSSVQAWPQKLSLTRFAHPQLRWTFQGDDLSSNIAVRLKPAVENTSPPKGERGREFAWAWDVKPVTGSSQYSRLHLAGTDHSRLARYLSFNQGAAAQYGSALRVGMYPTTRDANQESVNDADLAFTAPSLCSSLPVTCIDSPTQECNQVTGRCECRPGFKNTAFLDATDSYYMLSLDKSTLIDGHGLQCLPICANGGSWNAYTETCECLHGFSGEFCETDYLLCNRSYTLWDSLTTLTEATARDVITLQTHKHRVCGNGFVPAQITTTITSTQPPVTTITKTCPDQPPSGTQPQCQCATPYWTTHATNGKQCVHCTLKTTLIQPRFEQTYTNSPNTCYWSGTLLSTYRDGNCDRCQCRYGYAGQWCQKHQVYTGFNFTLDTNFIYDADVAHILNQKLISEFLLSSPKLGQMGIDQDRVTVQDIDLEKKYCVFGIETDTDFFVINQHTLDQKQQQQQQQQSQQQQSQQQQSQQQQSQQQQQQQQQDSSTSFNFFATTISSLIANNNNTSTMPVQVPELAAPAQLGSVYSSWDTLSSTFPSTPLGSKDTNSYLNSPGSSSAPLAAYDPACKEYYTGCDASRDQRYNQWPAQSEADQPGNFTSQNDINALDNGQISKGLLIGVTVGAAAGVVLFFVVTISLVKYAKRNETWCFAKPGDERVSRTNRHRITGSRGSGGASKSGRSGSSHTNFIAHHSASGSGSGSSKGASGSGSHRSGGSRPTPAPFDPKAAVELTEIVDPTLPQHWQKFEHNVTHEIIYINTETLTSQAHHPTATSAKQGKWF